MTFVIDTHCHLYLTEFAADLQVVITRARDHQVGSILVVGIDAETSRQAIQLSEDYEEVYAAVGIHPNSQVLDVDQELKTIASWVSHPKVVAIGEIGLDYYRQYVPIDEQMYRLQCQLNLALEENLPVIIHNRNAVEDLFPIVSKWVEKNQAKTRSNFLHCGVFHSFSEDEQWAQKIVALGFFIGISGVITFPNLRKIKDVVRTVPLSHLLIETDAPYLSPVPFRGKRNEPSYLLYTLQGISTVLGISAEVIANTTTQNAQTLFGIE